MALPEAIEEMLKTLPAEDQEALRPRFEKHQPLRDGYLRQNEFDRKFNEWKEQKEKEQAAIEARKAEIEKAIAEPRDWLKRNKSKHDQLLTEHKALETANQELTAQLEAAEAARNNGRETDMDEAAVKAAAQAVVDERVKALKIEQAGYITQKQMDDIVAKTKEEFFSVTLPQSMEFSARILDCVGDYRSEFGMKLDRIEFAKFMQGDGPPEQGPRFHDPYAAFKEFVAPKRAEATEKKRQKDLDDARTEGAEKARKEFAATAGVPGSGVPPAPSELGPMQRHVLGKDVQLPAGVEIGDGRAAMAAAESLRAEGKF